MSGGTCDTADLLGETPKQKRPSRNAQAETPKQKRPSRSAQAETLKQKRSSRSAQAEAPKQKRANRSAQAETPKQKRSNRNTQTETLMQDSKESSAGRLCDPQAVAVLLTAGRRQHGNVDGRHKRVGGALTRRTRRSPVAVTLVVRAPTR
jgi:hypothetical protein